MRGAGELKPDGVYVGEVMVTQTVKGTAFDAGGRGTLDPVAVGEKFWAIYQARAETSVTI